MKVETKVLKSGEVIEPIGMAEGKHGELLVVYRNNGKLSVKGYSEYMDLVEDELACCDDDEFCEECGNLIEDCECEYCEYCDELMDDCDCEYCDECCENINGCTCD